MVKMTASNVHEVLVIGAVDGDESRRRKAHAVVAATGHPEKSDSYEAGRETHLGGIALQ